MEQLWNDMRTTVCETLGIEQAPVTVNPEEDEVDSRVQSLSEELDIDALNDDFKKFAGVDGMLSRAEFNTFIKMKQIPSAVAGVLWSLLDRDNSGEVSKDEFKSALLALRNSQSWSRYCPACEYRNECAFCQECNSGNGCWRNRRTGYAISELFRAMFRLLPSTKQTVFRSA